MFINCKMKFVQQYLKSTIISIAKMNGKEKKVEEAEAGSSQMGKFLKRLESM